MDRQCITWHVYLDHTLRDWFYLTHNYAGLDLIKWLYAERRYCVTTSQKGVTADELLLFWAKRNGHHIISRDTYSDQDTSWLREAAAANYPRLHKFYTDGYSVTIPTLRIEAVYRQLDVCGQGKRLHMGRQHYNALIAKETEMEKYTNPREDDSLEAAQDEANRLDLGTLYLDDCNQDEDNETSQVADDEDASEEEGELPEDWDPDSWDQEDPSDE